MNRDNVIKLIQSTPLSMVMHFEPHEQIQQLRNMGFEDMKAVVHALESTAGDVVKALDQLTG